VTPKRPADGQGQAPTPHHAPAAGGGGGPPDGGGDGGDDSDSDGWPWWVIALAVLFLIAIGSTASGKR
jgi:hypothetical protein